MTISTLPTMMNDLNSIWNKLEESTSISTNIYKRYSAIIEANIFLGIDKKSNTRWIGLKTNLLEPSAEFPISEVLELTIINDSKQQIICVRLLNDKYNERFNVLCFDIINNRSTLKIGQFRLNRFFGIVQEWINIFRLKNRKKLSFKKQIGLFGELNEIIQLLNSNNGVDVIQSWTGPQNHHKDFQFGQFSLEVKATTKKRPKSITIQSEKQLTNYDNNPLYMVVYEVERSQEGLTIIDLIELIHSSLKDPMSLLQFNKKLTILFDIDAEYDYIKFKSIKRHVFIVEKDFPKITETILTDGLGNVSYTISLDFLKKFQIDSYGTS